MPRNHAQMLTRLSPEACQVRLQLRIRSWLAPRSWVARRRERPVTGKVSLTGFSIAKYGGLPAYAFKPKAIGSFQRTTQGTLVRVRTPMRVLPLALLCAFSWGGALALLMTGYGYMVREVYTHTPPLFMACLLAANIVLPTLVWLFWLHSSRQERRFLLDFLHVTLEAEHSAH